MTAPGLPPKVLGVEMKRYESCLVVEFGPLRFTIELLTHSFAPAKVRFPSGEFYAGGIDDCAKAIERELLAIREAIPERGK